MLIRGLKSAVKKHSAFTLAELLIVVAILGILAALVLPEVQGHSQRAKEAAAKENLRILRDAIERYAIEHNGIPPGYPGNNVSATPGNKAIIGQLVFGGYLPVWPKNPFNNKTTVYLVGNTESFPIEPLQQDLYGWIYQPASKTIRLNTSGLDSSGVAFFSY